MLIFCPLLVKRKVLTGPVDIINVVSVTSLASVNHLNEDKDDDVQSALYWRQALDVRNMELSVRIFPFFYFLSREGRPY